MPAQMESLQLLFRSAGIADESVRNRCLPDARIVLTQCGSLPLAVDMIGAILASIPSAEEELHRLATEKGVFPLLSGAWTEWY